MLNHMKHMISSIYLMYIYVCIYIEALHFVGPGGACDHLNIDIYIYIICTSNNSLDKPILFSLKRKQFGCVVTSLQDSATSTSSVQKFVRAPKTTASTHLVANLYQEKKIGSSPIKKGFTVQTSVTTSE